MKVFKVRPVSAIGGLWACLLSFCAGYSWADCRFVTPDTNVTITVTVPETLGVLKDLPIGTEVFRSPPVWLTGVADVRCSQDGLDRWGYFNHVGETAVSGPSPIGTTGLGWRWVYAGWQLEPYPNAGFAGATPGSVNRTSNWLQIVKMGNVISGTLPSGVIGTIRYGSNGLDVARMRLSNSVTFTEASCQTPSINVAMGKHRSRDFGAVGSTLGQTAFNIELKDCPSGLRGISYQLDPVNPALNAAQGLLALNSGGAKGVAIQITDSNKSPVGLGQLRRFTRSPASGNHYIPLSAAYYKTASEVTGGPANAALQFTITYQ